MIQQVEGEIIRLYPTATVRNCVYLSSGQKAGIATVGERPDMAGADAASGLCVGSSFNFRFPRS